MPIQSAKSQKSRIKVGARNKPVSTITNEDHRVRSGAARRQKTRKKLLAAAMAVFAEKGTETPLIDDFIAAAGVARGTFYNYFKTTGELLSAVTSELSDEISLCIEAEVKTISNPLERMATACLLYMHAGVTISNWGDFLARTGSRTESLGKLVDVYLPRDLELAKKAREIDYPAVRAARDLVISSITQAILTVNVTAASQKHLRQVLFLTLRGIGVQPMRATELSQLPLPHLIFPDWLTSTPKRR